MSDKLRPPTAEGFMQALAQIKGRPPAVERALQHYFDGALQVLAQSDTRLPLRAAAAGFAAGRVDAVGVGSATDAPDSLHAQGQVEPVVIHTVPDIVVQQWFAHTISSDTATTGPEAEQQPIALPPTFHLNRAIQFILTPKAYYRLIGPVMADCHYEYYEALKHHKPTRWIAIRTHLLVVWSVVRLPLEWIIRLWR